MVRLLRSGTRDGHFGPTVSSQANGLMEALLHDGFLTMVKLRGSVQAPCRINTEFWVADIDEAPSSFLIALVDKTANEIEVHLAATQNQTQRKGCFSALVNHLVSNHTSGNRIFARCYKKSTWAVSALQKLGFKVSKPGDPVELSK